MPQVGTTARINSLRNLCLAELTTDSPTALAFGPGLPLGVESELTWTPQIVMEDLKGARGTVESDKYIDFLNWDLKHGEINLDIWALTYGGAVVNKVESAAGAADSKSLFALKQGLAGKTFGLIGQPVTTKGGPADFYIALLKCQMEKHDPGKLGGGSWVNVGMGGRAFYTNKDKLLFGAAILEKRTDMTFAVVTTDVAAFMAG